MGKTHDYTLSVVWTGNSGEGTTSYLSFERAYEVRIEGKPVLQGSADPAFRGDGARHNPEDMLLASLSACHMLWYLHLCAVNGIVVTRYEDAAEGVMEQEADGGGRFVSVMLKPRVEITAASDQAKAEALHAEASEKCFIARSVNFPIGHEATITRA